MNPKLKRIKTLEDLDTNLGLECGVISYAVQAHSHDVLIYKEKSGSARNREYVFIKRPKSNPENLARVTIRKPSFSLRGDMSYEVVSMSVVSMPISSPREQESKEVAALVIAEL